MRIAHLAGRAVLLTETGAVDIEEASAGRFGPGPQMLFEEWEAFVSWSASATLPRGSAYDPEELGAPAPAPRQVFGIGLNYREHALEAGIPVPESPVVFTKFPSCVTGPGGDIVLPPGGDTDWEVEVVAVIGRRAEHVPVEQGWDHIAGLTVGQDISERLTQMAGPAAQFSLGKSFPGFAPTGPWLVTPDEFADRDDILLECAVGGDQVQRGRTGDMVFSVPELVARLSAVLPLLPGDLIFTGTPPGIGGGMTPPRFLTHGEELISTVQGIGTMRHRMVASA